MTKRLSQEDILEAVQMLLRERGELPNEKSLFRYKFGLVGEPMITLVGDAIDLPDAGKVYVDWRFDVLTKAGSA